MDVDENLTTRMSTRSWDSLCSCQEEHCSCL